MVAVLISRNEYGLVVCAFAFIVATLMIDCAGQSWSIPTLVLLPSPALMPKPDLHANMATI